VIAWTGDRLEEGLSRCEQGLELARARGDRVWERQLLGAKISTLAALGRWDEALEVAEGLGVDRAERGSIFYLSDALIGLARIRSARGDGAGLRRLGELIAEGIESGDAQIRSSCKAAKAIVAQAAGRPAEALGLARPLIDYAETTARRFAYAEACLAAWRLESESELAELIAHVDALPPARVVPSMRAHADRFTGLLAARRGEPAIGVERLRDAGARFREFGYPFELGEVLLETGEILRDDGRAGDAEPLLAEAGRIFRELRAEPWLERVVRTRGGEGVRGASASPRG